MRIRRLLGNVPTVTIAFATVVLVFAACRPQASTVESAHIDVLLDWQPTPSFIGFYMAEQAGLYKEAGVDVSFSYGKGASDAAKVISTGRYAAGTSSAEATVVGITKGMPIISRAVLYPVVSTVLLTRSDLEIKEPTDLYDKTIGLNPASATYHDYVWLTGKYKLDRSRIHEINIGFGVTPLLTKQVDIILDYSEQSPVELQVQGQPINQKRLRDFGLDSYGFNIIVNANEAKNRPAVLERFVKASVQGYELASANPDKAAELFFSQHPERSRNFVLASVREVIANLGKGPIGQQDEVGWERTIKNLTLSGLIQDRDPDLVRRIMNNP